MPIIEPKYPPIELAKILAEAVSNNTISQEGPLPPQGMSGLGPLVGAAGNPVEYRTTFVGPTEVLVKLYSMSGSVKYHTLSATIGWLPEKGWSPIA